MGQIILLPKPQTGLEFPLMKALELRRTKRKWKAENLTLQEISNILWAACGITMEGTPRSKCKRTAPSARNAQAISVYVALDSGLFRYNEQKHELILVVENDMREHLSNQKMMKSAPLGLIYVSDYSKLKGYTGINENQKWFISGTETGFISQNVYLYCASANLSTAIIGLVNRDKLHELMALQEFEKIVYTQIIGQAI